jgi:hypothetical protein
MREDYRRASVYAVHLPYLGGLFILISLIDGKRVHPQIVGMLNAVLPVAVAEIAERDIQVRADSPWPIIQDDAFSS